MTWNLFNRPLPAAVAAHRTETVVARLEQVAARLQGATARLEAVVSDLEAEDFDAGDSTDDA